MGLFDTMKATRLGDKAKKEHIAGNDLCKRGKPGEAQAKFIEADKLYREAYAAGCRRTDILNAQSVLMMRLGQFEEARELMKEISKTRVLNEQMHFELRCDYALCLWRLGLLDEAIKTIEFAGKHAKTSMYYTSLCTFLIDKFELDGEDEEHLVRMLDESLDYDEEDAATLDNFGAYWRVKYTQAKTAGDTEAAVEARKKSLEYYKKAHEKKANQITTLYALACFAEEDGDRKKALELIDRAIMHWSSRVCAVSIEQLQEVKNRLK